jgi:hypothetical protein
MWYLEVFGGDGAWIDLVASAVIFPLALIMLLKGG